MAKKSNNLIKAGYITKKGHFGIIKKGGIYNTPNEPMNLSNVTTYLKNYKNNNKKIKSSKKIKVFCR